MTEVTLTEEQKAFIAECEEEFKDRFTDRDEEFMKIKNVEPNPPPIMDPWYNKPPRNFDWSRQNQGHDNRRHNQGFKRRHDRADRRHHSVPYHNAYYHHNNYKRHYSQ